MCLVVDANCFGSVFNSKSNQHARFAPVFKWLMTGHGGRLIYGGTKYKKEVASYRPLLAELERKGRLLIIPDDSVNKVAAELKRRVPHSDFDDEHIVALVVVSKCCVVCTDDKQSHRFLRRKTFYPTGMKPPKIYQSPKHAKLCCSDHVVEICQEKQRKSK